MHYDLIIVGGGLVGAGLANALRCTSLSIAVVDARLPSHEDPRLFALTSSSCQFLKNLDLWPQLAQHASPIHHVHVSYQKHFGVVRLNREDVHLPSLGYVIPASVIEMALHNALTELPNISLFRKATLTALTQLDGEATLTLNTDEGEKILRANMVIGADGTDSSVRTKLAIETEIFDYEQCAIVTKTTLSRPHQYVAYERFNAKGAIAMLPLIGDTCATIWTTDNQTTSHLMTLSDELFLQSLQKEFGYRLGRLQKISQRYVFPLRMIRAEKAVVGCVYLLGNALHTLHPIAAQGFNLALYEVAAFVEMMMRKEARCETISATDLLQLSLQTQKQQTLSVSVSHRLSRLFSSDSVLTSIALQLGMVGFSTLTPIKKKFIEGIMGRRGSVPHLLLSANEL